MARPTLHELALAAITVASGDAAKAYAIAAQMKAAGDKIDSDARAASAAKNPRSAPSTRAEAIKQAGAGPAATPKAAPSSVPAAPAAVASPAVPSAPAAKP